eukprot:1159439-Pelagomonas_calceolata.AAC.8
MGMWLCTVALQCAQVALHRGKWSSGSATWLCNVALQCVQVALQRGSEHVTAMCTGGCATRLVGTWLCTVAL